METKTNVREVRARNGNLIGYFKGNTLFKKVQGSKHRFRKIGDRGSCGIDYDALHTDLPERAAIEIYDSEEEVKYLATAARFKEYGTILHFKEGTADHYTQVFLPVEYFDVVRFKR